MNTTARRLRRLEEAAGLDGGELCACPTMNREMRVYHPPPGASDASAEADADPRPAEVCGRCGKPKQIIKFIILLEKTGLAA